MKNILVIGPPRVGKTTFSKLIVKSIPCFSVINVDVIRESIYKSMCSDMTKQESKKIVKNAFPIFLRTMLKQYTRYYNPDLFYVIEGDLLSIDDALEIKKEYDIDIVCVGVPKISETNLFNRIRTNASIYGCWTKEYNDEELYELCKEIIEQSNDELLITKENNLTYLDNSNNSDCFQKYINDYINVNK